MTAPRPMTPAQVRAAVEAAQAAGAQQVRIERDAVVIVMGQGQAPHGNPADLVRMDD